MKLSELRENYTKGGLLESEVDPDPIHQFRFWFEQAVSAHTGCYEPNAMTLATAAPDGTPSARMVLLKGFDERGFVFFTNYESRKAGQIEANPKAALVFYWPDLERQVRVSGSVEKVSREESDAYFQSRPAGSQLGAWASPQSSPVPGRDVLEKSLASVADRFGSGPIPTPPFWGGYRVVPSAVEFWQGRPNRLHDRIIYTLQAGGDWRIERLAP